MSDFCLFFFFCLGLLAFFACAARADSADFVRSSLITRCWASSMIKVIRSSAFIAFACCPESLLALSAAVIVWRVGQYDSGREDIIIVLNQVSDIVDPIFIRLSQCWSMSWKWVLSSLRWVLGSSLSISFMLEIWSSVSNRYNVLFDMALSFIEFHISLAVGSAFIFVARRVDVVDTRMWWAKYSLFSNSMVFDSFCSNWSSVATVLPSANMATPLVIGNGTGTEAVPSTCLHRPFAPMAYCILGW
jgi:hypothetical protein